MKKALWSALAVSTLFALFGCNNRSETQVLQPTQNEELKPMQQSWRGVLPCADCEGIETSLFLQKRRYVGHESAVSGRERTLLFCDLRDMGTHGRETGVDRYERRENVFPRKGEGMEMLDREGNPIESQFNYTLAPVKSGAAGHADADAGHVFLYG